MHIQSTTLACIFGESTLAEYFLKLLRVEATCFENHDKKSTNVAEASSSLSCLKKGDSIHRLIGACRRPCFVFPLRLRRCSSSSLSKSHSCSLRVSFSTKSRALKLVPRCSAIHSVSYSFKQNNRVFQVCIRSCVFLYDDDQLPKFLFREGTDTQVDKVKNTCRTSILKKVEKYVEVEYKEVLADPLFSQVMAIYVHKLKLRMVYLCVIAGMVMAKDERVSIPHKYIKLVMDFDKMRRYMWGLHSFDALVTSITDNRDIVKTQNSYVIDGFSYALQIWLMEAIPDIGSLLGKKLRESVISMRCRNWKGSAKVSYEDIDSIESDFAFTGDVFPYISSTGNCNIIVDASFERHDEIRTKGSEEDGSEEAEAGETSETGVEEEVETAHVSPAKKRKNQYQDVGAESRKKRLLCQRSTDKYRDHEEEKKSYIQGMFKSSFIALEREVRDLIEDRFTKLEEKLLSSQTQVEVPAYTQTRGADLAYTNTPAAAMTSTQARASDSTHASAPTPASTHTSVPAPTISRSRASGLSNTSGPANAAKTSLFSTIDVNLGTQEHLQKTMGNITQESNVDCFDPSQDKQFDNPSVFSTPMTSFRPEILKRPFLTDIDDPEVRVLQIGPSTFDAELVSRIMGPNIWLKNYIITAYGKFDGNRSGYKLDNNLLEYGRGAIVGIWNSLTV
ncbi:hypothetical protein Bca4012_020326 [Brassica carinata]